MTITNEKITGARAALRHAADRFGELLATVPDPEVRATRSWSVTRTAAHVASLAWACTAIVAPGRDAAWDEALDARFRATNVDNVRDLNVLLLRRYAEESDLDRLATRFRQDVNAVLAMTDGWDPAQAVNWLGGSRLPIAGLFAHLANELHIHGWDIARAIRAPWTIPAPDAALFLELFLAGLIRHGYGGLLDSTPPPPRRRITVQFRSRHLTPMTIALDGTTGGTGNRDRVTVEEPGPDDDVRVSFHPPTLNLMLFGRISAVRAALTGKVVVWGPRPWLLPAFLRTLHMPNN